MSNPYSYIRYGAVLGPAGGGFASPEDKVIILNEREQRELIESYNNQNLALQRLLELNEELIKQLQELKELYKQK